MELVWLRHCTHAQRSLAARQDGTAKCEGGMACARGMTLPSMEADHGKDVLCLIPPLVSPLRGEYPELVEGGGGSSWISPPFPCGCARIAARRFDHPNPCQPAHRAGEPPACSPPMDTGRPGSTTLVGQGQRPWRARVNDPGGPGSTTLVGVRMCRLEGRCGCACSRVPAVRHGRFRVHPHCKRLRARQRETAVNQEWQQLPETSGVAHTVYPVLKQERAG